MDAPQPARSSGTPFGRAAPGRVLQNRGLLVAAQVAKVAFIGFSVIPAVLGAMQVWSRWGDGAPGRRCMGCTRWSDSLSTSASSRR